MNTPSSPRVSVNNVNFSRGCVLIIFFIIFYEICCGDTVLLLKRSESFFVARLDFILSILNRKAINPVFWIESGSGSRLLLIRQRKFFLNQKPSYSLGLLNPYKGHSGSRRYFIIFPFFADNLACLDPKPGPLTHLNPDPEPKHWKNLKSFLSCLILTVVKKHWIVFYSRQYRVPSFYQRFRVQTSVHWIRIMKFWWILIQIQGFDDKI